MHVIIGSDHGGFQLKEKIKNWLRDRDYDVVDVGAVQLVDGDDYVDYAKAAVKEAVSTNDRVILLCRNGFGMSIAANRFVGVRCGLAFGEEAVRKGSTDDDINCLAVPADYVDETEVMEMVQIFLDEKFDGGESYRRRIMKLDNLIQ